MEKEKDRLILLRQDVKLEHKKEKVPSIAIVIEGKIKEALDVVSAITNMSYEEIISRSLIDGISNMIETLSGND